MEKDESPAALGILTFLVALPVTFVGALGLSWWLDTRFEIADGWTSWIVFGGIGLLISFVIEVLLEVLGEVFIRGRAARITAFVFFLAYVLVWSVVRALP